MQSNPIYFEQYTQIKGINSLFLYGYQSNVLYYKAKIYSENKLLQVTSKFPKKYEENRSRFKVGNVLQKKENFIFRWIITYISQPKLIN